MFSYAVQLVDLSNDSENCIFPKPQVVSLPCGWSQDLRNGENGENGHNNSGELLLYSIVERVPSLALQATLAPLSLSVQTAGLRSLPCGPVLPFYRAVALAKVGVPQPIERYS